MLTENFIAGLKNPGITHIFLGDPLSDRDEKTVVEPGNIFSPGIASFGVFPVIQTEELVTDPSALLPEDLSWKFRDTPAWEPVIEADYRCGTVSVKHALGHFRDEKDGAVDINSITFESDCDTLCTLHLVLKGNGPAGGTLDSAAQTGQCVRINNRSELCFDTGFRFSYAPEEKDPFAVISIQAEIKAGTPHVIRFDVRHGCSVNQFRPRSNVEFPTAWRHALPALIECPDRDLVNTWNQCAYHIMAAMENGLPRIGAVNYPVFWMRDCVIVMRALDLMGRSDLGRIGNDYLAPLLFSGGFGAESDAPGEGIWSLVQHAVITNDTDWLSSVFSHIEKRAELLISMMNTDKTLRHDSADIMPRHRDNPEASLLCHPSEKGLIHGRMDWHSPDFYINSWAYAGLVHASRAADLVGERDKTDTWFRLAEQLESGVKKYLLSSFGNPRDAVITPYPCGLLAEDPVLAEAFRKWFCSTRLSKTGQRIAERLWTYFEAAQIHNAFILGLRNEAWTCLSGMLSDSAARGVSAYIEGTPSGNEFLPYGRPDGLNGWLDPENALGGNMPHNWTTAELINCIRDMFVLEKNGELLLGIGVPEAWLVPGNTFGVQNMPTSYGTVSYTAAVRKNGEIEIDYDGPEFWREVFSI